MLNEDPYLVFLRWKIEVAPCLGFDVDPEEINPIMKPHQRDIVRWAPRSRPDEK